MQVLGVDRLEAAWTKHPDAQKPLAAWLCLTQTATWKTMRDLRQVFPSADAVDLGGRIVTIFNIKGNTYRLIVRVNYRLQMVIVGVFLTHAEYDKEKWKMTL